MKISKIVLIAAWLASVWLAGCAPSSEDEEPSGSRAEFADTGNERDSRVVLRLGVPAHPNPQSTHPATQPLVDHLDAATSYRIEYRIGRSAEQIEIDPTGQDLVTFIEERLVELAPLGALSYCLADDRFGVRPLARLRNHDGEALDRSVFVVPVASDIDEINDVNGRRLALGPAHSTLAHLVPRYELERAAVDPEVLDNLESELAVFDAVRDGTYDVGAAAHYWVNGATLVGLRVLHDSAPIPSRAIVVRRDLPEPVQEALRGALLTFNGGPTGVADGAMDFAHGFVAGDAAEFVDVCGMVDTVRSSCSQSCHGASE